MNAKITQGKRQLWQWDTGVQLMLFDIGTANEVHFATPDGVIRRDIVNNMCNIPDVVLQRAGTMVCYVFNREPYEGDTRHEFHFEVLPRPKPADYIDPPDEADYIDLIAERAAKALPLFIVHVERVDGVLRADKLPWEIDAAADKGHACVMVYASNTLAYCGRKEKHPAFIGQPAKKTNGMFYVDVAYVLDDGTVDITPSSYIAAMTAKPLVFKGAVNATFTGTETTYVTIPDGGVSQEEIDEAVDKALTEAKESGEFDGASGKDGKDGVDGKDGTSVTITSISQSTEDDGYSVVTFSDGKQLRVKNGSKGSAGEGGAGGGVLTVTCTPTEDMQSFTASHTVAEIYEAFAQGKAVQAYVLGLDIVAHVFMVTEDVVLFSAVASFAGESMAVTLNMMADGTNAMIVAPMGGMVVANITTEDGETYTTDKTAEELYAAVTMGTPVYASFMGAYVPAQYIGEESSVFRAAVPGGTVTAIIDGSGVTVDVAPEGGGGDGGEVIVDVARDGDVYTTSMQADAIYTAYAAGKRIVCRADLPKVTGMLLQPTYISDVLVVFTGAFTDALFASDGSMVVSVAIPNANTAQVVINTLDKLPNPEPLTINGTSYDGSEAVNIDIAAGGGGGGDEGVYELIETYTTTESVAFERTQEPDGIKYKFKALLVKFDIASGTSGYFRLNANYGNTSLGGCIITPISNSRCYAMFATTQEKGFWRDMSCDAITVQDRFTTPIFHGWGDLTSKGVQRFPYNSKLISSGPIPAGVKMEIWGVRV